MYFSGTDHVTTLTWTHTMFIDGVYLIHATHDKAASIEELKDQIQMDINRWNNGLRFSGKI